MTNSKKTLILAQVFISLMMAFLMSGIMSVIALGPTNLWLRVWPQQFLLAWPIAFCLSLVVSRLGFAFSARLTRG